MSPQKITEQCRKFKVCTAVSETQMCYNLNHSNGYALSFTKQELFDDWLKKTYS